MTGENYRLSMQLLQRLVLVPALIVAVGANAWAVDATSYRREADKKVQAAKDKEREAVEWEQRARDARSGKEKCPLGSKPEDVARSYETLAKNCRNDARRLVQEAEEYRRKADDLEKAAKSNPPKS